MEVVKDLVDDRWNDLMAFRWAGRVVGELDLLLRQRWARVRPEYMAKAYDARSNE